MHCEFTKPQRESVCVCVGSDAHLSIATHKHIFSPSGQRMSARHSLALPLSADYAHDVRSGFSFFTTTAETADEALPPTVEKYLDDLCTFFRAARLIQAHPDNYFQFMREETWVDAAVHFDGSPVEKDELRETKRLLRGFAPLLHGEDAMTRLRSLVRDGPPPLPPSTSTSSAAGTAATGDDADSLQALHDFYAQTRRLMMSRARRLQNDAASATLLSPSAAASEARGREAISSARARQAQILDLVVSHGMNPKKQHEVRIMRDTVHDLVECCNAGLVERTAALASGFDEEGRPASAAPSAGSAVRVETAINIGEGKGYVSRAVALCDNLQVVGLDCNPAHKERAVERVESLLETSLSSRDGRPRVNLLYEPRGHVASVACRVEAAVDWRALLQGHVLIREEEEEEGKEKNACECGSAGCGDHKPSSPSCTGSSSSEVIPPTPQGAETDTTVLSYTRGEETVKLACRLCGKVVRLENTTVVMKHVYAHLREAGGAAGTAALVTNEQRALSSAGAESSSMPSTAQVREWNLTLSQHAYVAKLTETFFTVADVDARHHDSRKEAALLKRNREDDDGESDAGVDVDKGRVEPAAASHLTLHRAASAAVTAVSSGEASHSATAAAARITLQPTHTARGYRAVLLLARAVPLAADAGESGPADTTTTPTAAAERGGAGSGDAPRTRTTATTPTRWVYEEQLATIVGYDGGVDGHQVCLDVENKKRMLRLYRIPSTPGAPAPQSLRLTLPSASSSPSAAAGASPALLGAWQLPDPAIWGQQNIAVVRSVLPPALPSTPAVSVPSVRNTLLIGLHPCGDLGSNVCRIFCNSAARGLLLVSCCWHSLTPHGFPLSQALQRRGMTTNSVSLLLATQPLDAWSSASPEGHRSSAKLLFYRSLFKLLWAQLAREWAAAPHTCATRGVEDRETESAKACEFPAPPPHLEPVFLRRLSRDKDTMTFPAFVEAVATEYLYKESAKDTPYTPWNIGTRCAACRDAQEAYVRSALTARALPQQLSDMYDKEHFAQFLGLTVLRMWMCHLVESLFLLDRTLYLHEELCRRGCGEDSAVSLVPLFDGALSPRMYGILARRGGSA